jgi:hypothetical protein
VPLTLHVCGGETLGQVLALGDGIAEELDEGLDEENAIDKPEDSENEVLVELGEDKLENEEASTLEDNVTIDVVDDTLVGGVVDEVADAVEDAAEDALEADCVEVLLLKEDANIE